MLPTAIATIAGRVILTLSLGCALAAQTAPIQGHWETVRLASGVHANPTPVAGVVWRDFITLPAATPWLRVYFKNVELEGDSLLRIASLRDGDVQTMNRKHVEQWEKTTAYFNGGTVMIELVAGPNTTKNLVEVDRVMAGDVDPQLPLPETICGTTDNRVPSSDPRSGRIVGIGCSGWIVSAPTTGNDRLHLSAGHCVAASQVLQFNVPASSTSCALVMPSANFQFAIDTPGSLSLNNGIGNDYWVFRCFPNTNTGLTTFQTMNAAFTLATSMPAAGTTLVNWGYGLDGTPTNNGANAGSCGCASPNGARNQTQQTHTGPLVLVSGTTVAHQIDTCGGNSGSVVANNSTGQAIAIHTNAGCTSTTGNNTGTAVTHTGLVAAIAALASGGGGTPPANDNCANATTIVAGTNGPFSSNFATAGSTFSCVAAGGADVWFRYAALGTGIHTFTTCTATRNFDTTIELFSGTCAGLTSLACNDDINGTCGLGSQITPTLTAGQTYLIHVGGFNAATGDFDIVVTAPAIAGDDCSNAITIAPGVNGPYNNASATVSTPAWPCGFGSQKDIWYRITPACSAPMTFYTCTPTRTFDTVLEIFSGTCASLTSLACNDDACDGLGSRVTTSVTAGQTYFLRVGGFNGASGGFDLVAEYGSGTGVFTDVGGGCGPMTLTATGAPHIDGTIVLNATGFTGAPFIGLGFNLTPAPFCGCTIGHDWAVLAFGSSYTIPVPCLPAFIGTNLGAQGADFLGTGGCPNPQIGFSSTIVITIG